MKNNRQLTRFKDYSSLFNYFNSDLRFNFIDSMFNHPFFIDFNSESDTDFNQIVSENEGKLTITNGEDETGSWERKEWMSDNGQSRVTSYIKTSSNFGKGKNLPTEAELKDQIRVALEEENYEEAAKLKKQLPQSTSNSKTKNK